MTVRAAAGQNEPALFKPAAGGGDPLFGAGARDILTAVGEVLYDWTIGDDRIRWGANVLDVLGIGAIEDVASGVGFASFLDSANLSSRRDAVFNSAAKDEGDGAAYQIQYAFLPERQADGGTLWIEDIGRWYGDANGRPVRAHGVIRVIN